MTEVKKKPLSRAMYVAMVLLVAIVGLCFTANITLTIKVTEEMAQGLVDAQLVKLREKQPPYDIEYANIHFLDDHMTIEAGGGLERQIGEQVATMSARLSSEGSPSYDNGSVYFVPSEFKLDTFLLNGEEPSDYLTRIVDTLATEQLPTLRDEVLANPTVSKWADRLGVNVDTAANDIAIAAAATAVDNLIEEYRAVIREVLENAVRDLLQTTPLYTLGKNWKERVAMAALSDITVKDGTLQVTLTGFRLLTTLLIGLLGVLFVGFVAYGLLGANRRAVNIPS